MISAVDALARLRDGNHRFATDTRRGGDLATIARRQAVAASQEPFAIILGCSDSRVPAELVFDQGVGDLFVIRVAGNIVAPSLVGSVEFAASQFGTRLVVVLGHSQCGAIAATLNEIRRPSGSGSKNIKSIVDRVRPALEEIVAAEPTQDVPALMQRAVRANVRSSADHLRHGSELLEDLIATDGLLVIGAEYSLETGEVDFFDGAPSPG